MKGKWVDKQDLPVEFNSEQMFIKYQTGKGGDHLVPVLFAPECIKAMFYLTKKEVRRNAGTPDKNRYIFARTQNSLSRASGRHCINEILIRLDKKVPSLPLRVVIILQQFWQNWNYLKNKKS